MRTLAEATERNLARHGWDNMEMTPMLGIVAGVTHGEEVAYMTLPFPFQPKVVDPDEPVAGLVRIGADLLSGQLPMASPPPGLAADVAGLVFVAEGWMNTVEPGDRDGRALADIPGSKEIRMVHILDCAGRLHVCRRERGNEPTVATVEFGDGEAEAAGAVVDGMRKVLIWLARAMPLGSVELDKVRMVGVNKPEWMQDDPEDVAW